MTGLAEASASFSAARSGKSMTLAFSLERPGADWELLERLRDYFGGIGRLYPGRGPRGRALFRVNRRDELLLVVEHFELHPLQAPTRIRTFGVWRRMVELKAAHFRRPPLAELLRLAAELREAGRATGPRSTRS